MKSLGENLRMIRTTRGMTQGEAAQRAGVTQAMMSAFERGQGDPALSTLRKIAAAYEISLSEMFATEPNPPLPGPPRPPTREEMALFVLEGIRVSTERRDALKAVLEADEKEFSRITQCIERLRIKQA